LIVGGWDAAAVAVKAIVYAATLCAAGAVFFLVYSHALVPAADRLRIARLIRLLSLVALCASGAQIVVSAGSMSGAVSDMMSLPLLRMAWAAGMGRAILVRAVGLGLANAGTSALRRPTWVAVAGAAIAATSFAWMGHTHSLVPEWPPIFMLCVHLSAAAFWLGALAPLLVVARNRDLSVIAAAAARFGSMAVYGVGALLAAGLILLGWMLGDVSHLWNDPYGRWLASKLALVAVLLSLAAFNKLRLTPRLAAGDTAALHSLCTSIRIEIGVGALILAATAALTTLDGPPSLD
jgi:putative copper resistance protein D